MRKFLLLPISLVSIIAYAHPGKTDANGCHTNKKTGEYHCHTKGGKTTPKKKQLSNFENVQLIFVYDGDTFKIQLPCKKGVLCEEISVRVKGIDTPEIKSKNACEKEKAKEAKAFTKKFLEEGKINLTDCNRDKYFRLLCNVEVKKNDLADSLIVAKLAVKYNGGKKKTIDWCKK